MTDPQLNDYNNHHSGFLSVLNFTYSLCVLLQATWYAVVANADFMLHDVQNEAFAEQLRERRRLYREKNKPLDFWLVSEPAWLSKQFPKEAARVRRPCVALVSADKIWMK